MITLTAIRGDTTTFTLTVTDDAGDPYDLTDADIAFSVRHLFSKRLGDGIEVDDAPSGIATITLNPEDTAAAPNYRVVNPFDVQIEQVDGTVSTPIIGRFVVIPDVTESPSS